MEKDVRSVAASGLLWRLLERFGAQGVTFIVTVILARLLDPAVYGTVALITAFTTILNVFIDSGLGSALIQKKDTDDLDFSSIFYFNLFLCIALYAGVFFLAPALAAFYNNPNLTVLIRVSSLTLVISGVANVQIAYVTKHMFFKRFFISTLGGTIGSAVVSIIMAYLGFGVWAIIAQNLLNQFINTLILWKTVKWCPKMMFSFARLKDLFSYGWKLLCSSLLNTVFSRINDLIIGKMYSPEDLAFYSKGNTLPSMAVLSINSSIDSVLFPMMATEQNNLDAVKAMTRRSIKLCSYIMWPIMMGLAACAEPLIECLLTSKWLPCAPYFVIYCVIYAFFPINTANLNAIKAIGRSDLILKLEIIKKVCGVVILLCTMHHGILTMSYGFLISSLLCQVINAWPNRKLLNYSHGEQLKDIMPAMCLAVFMWAAVNAISLFGFSAFATLLIQIPLGVTIYVLGSIIFKLDSFNYLLSILCEYVQGKKGTS